MNIYTSANTVTQCEPFVYLWIDKGTWVEEHQCFKRYVGRHNGSKGYRYEGSGVYFREAFEERPEDFHRIIIIHDSDYKFIDDQEEFILKSVSAAANSAWYNATESNWPPELNAEIREKIRLKQIGKPGPNRGKKFSAEHRKNLSASHTGEKNHTFGKKREQWIVEKIAKANTGRKRTPEQNARNAAAQRGRTASDETKQKMSFSRSGERNGMFGRKGEDNPSFGIKHKKKECPHCKKMIPINTFNRWHGDKCKEKLP